VCLSSKIDKELVYKNAVKKSVPLQKNFTTPRALPPKINILVQAVFFLSLNSWLIF
jgi:hypothetical protein